ncbi:non-ribosomal peptide synthetase [Phlyctema vagabunda]|uniref:Non-ribosomal peptide synthetase n=1 Tax=Phlyctema vagabunda TaxID=108571 RepID=A0ABR4P3P2_9HELO
MSDTIVQESLEKAQIKPNLESCEFPTQPRNITQSLSFGTLELNAIHGEATSVKKSYEILQRALEVTWAILLRNYVRKESVLFAKFPTMQYSGTTSFGDKSVPYFSDAQTTICRYEVPIHCSLGSIKPVLQLNVSAAELEEYRINTAISFFISERRCDEVRTENARLMNNFDLILELYTVNDTFEIVLKYNTATIPYRYAKSVVTSYEGIWKAVIVEKLAIDGFGKINSSDIQQQMISANPKIIFSQMTCMHYLVAAAARVTPHGEAVCAWDGDLKYLQLDTLSSIAAEKLGRIGVGPGRYVPFAFEKSMWAVVSTLAILKSGAAFVPLDVNQPMKRLQVILSSLSTDVMVSSTFFAKKFAQLAKHVIEISPRTMSLEHSKSRSGLYSTFVKPNDPIFVLFTSGSTGTPKGMVHEHGAICTHAVAHGTAMGYQRARVLQFAAHTFDVAIIDFFTTLIFGGCICIPSEEARTSNITAAINDMKVDYALLTPSFARIINPSAVPSLKTLVLGGEALPQDGLHNWMKHVKLLQVYGPADVGICLSIEMLRHKTRPETVGYPLPNCSCWLIDPVDHNMLVPVGAVGELVVGGPSLAREYLNDESRTAASFLDNPRWAETLQLQVRRFFRTGDLLRYNTDLWDGSFDFVGRKDLQIKLHGQRIEPAEIEYQMAELSGVVTSMVTRPNEGHFKGKLIAIIEMDSGVESQISDELIRLSTNIKLSDENVKQKLSKTLPQYMVPGAYIFIEKMPLLPSMKIDRRTVELWLNSMTIAPAIIGEILHTNLKASLLDATEITARKISGKVADLVSDEGLQLFDAIKNHNFVLQATGIDSIQVISLNMFLEKELGIRLSVASLLDSEITIRDLARIVDKQEAHLKHIDIAQKYAALSTELLERIDALQPLYSDFNKALGPPRNIFITGASGYLGISILEKLFSVPEVKIFALVRCTDATDGHQRIVNSCKAMGWWKNCFLSRIEVWKGDLAKKNFGLSDHQLKCLRGTNGKVEDKIHGIIHNGAKVHYSSDYHSVEHVNVHSTSWLLEVAALSTHISTFVFVSGGQKPEHIFDFEALSKSQNSDINRANGYTQTKLISELLVKTCASHIAFTGIRTQIIKPGYIIGSSPFGIANKRDFIWRLIAGCLEIGAYNADELANWLFIADTDRVSEYIVSSISRTAHALQPTSLVEDGIGFAELWHILEDDFGYTLEALPFHDWLSRLTSAIYKRGEDHLLFPLIHILESESGVLGLSQKPISLEAEFSTRVKGAVKDNLRHLIGIGFLPALVGMSN